MIELPTALNVNLSIMSIIVIVGATVVSVAKFLFTIFKLSKTHPALLAVSFLSLGWFYCYSMISVVIGFKPDGALQTLMRGSFVLGAILMGTGPFIILCPTRPTFTKLHTMAIRRTEPNPKLNKHPLGAALFFLILIAQIFIEYSLVYVLNNVLKLDIRFILGITVGYGLVISFFLVGLFSIFLKTEVIYRGINMLDKIRSNILIKRKNILYSKVWNVIHFLLFLIVFVLIYVLIGVVFHTEETLLDDEDSSETPNRGCHIFLFALNSVLALIVSSQVISLSFHPIKIGYIETAQGSMSTSQIRYIAIARSSDRSVLFKSHRIRDNQNKEIKGTILYNIKTAPSHNGYTHIETYDSWGKLYQENDSKCMFFVGTGRFYNEDSAFLFLDRVREYSTSKYYKFSGFELYPFNGWKNDCKEDIKNLANTFSNYEYISFISSDAIKMKELKNSKSFLEHLNKEKNRRKMVTTLKKMEELNLEVGNQVVDRIIQTVPVNKEEKNKKSKKDKKKKNKKKGKEEEEEEEGKEKEKGINYTDYSLVNLAQDYKKLKTLRFEETKTLKQLIQKSKFKKSQGVTSENLYSHIKGSMYVDDFGVNSEIIQKREKKLEKTPPPKSSLNFQEWESSNRLRVVSGLADILIENENWDFADKDRYKDVLVEDKGIELIFNENINNNGDDDDDDDNDTNRNSTQSISPDVKVLRCEVERLEEQLGLKGTEIISISKKKISPMLKISGSGLIIERIGEIGYELKKKKKEEQDEDDDDDDDEKIEIEKEKEDEIQTNDEEQVLIEKSQPLRFNNHEDVKVFSNGRCLAYPINNENKDGVLLIGKKEVSRKRKFEFEFFIANTNPDQIEDIEIGIGFVPKNDQNKTNINEIKKTAFAMISREFSESDHEQDDKKKKDKKNNKKKNKEKEQSNSNTTSNTEPDSEKDKKIKKKKKKKKQIELESGTGTETESEDELEKKKKDKGKEKEPENDKNNTDVVIQDESEKDPELLPLLKIANDFEKKITGDNFNLEEELERNLEKENAYGDEDGEGDESEFGPGFIVIPPIKLNSKISASLDLQTGELIFKINSKTIFTYKEDLGKLVDNNYYPMIWFKTDSTFIIVNSSEQSYSNYCNYKFHRVIQQYLTKQDYYKNSKWTNVVTNYPINDESIQFEMKIVKCSTPLSILNFGVGFIKSIDFNRENDLNCEMGNDDRSIIYMAHSGMIKSNGVFKVFGPAYHQGDTISCFVNIKNGYIAFAKNGMFLGVGHKFKPFTSLYPIFSFGSNDIKIKLNFIGTNGKNQFKYPHAFGESTDLPFLSKNISPLLHDSLQRLFQTCLYPVTIIHEVQKIGQSEIARLIRRCSHLINIQLKNQRPLTIVEQLSVDLFIRLSIMRFRPLQIHQQGDLLNNYSQNKNNFLDPFAIEFDHKPEKNEDKTAIRLQSLMIEIIKSFRWIKFTNSYRASQFVNHSIHAIRDIRDGLELQNKGLTRNQFIRFRLFSDIALEWLSKLEKSLIQYSISKDAIELLTTDYDYFETYSDDDDNNKNKDDDDDTENMDPFSVLKF
ncbi:ran-binding protein 9/10 [Anaeramoeba flamelloides]|uniref:Ran-binding protein 9/10 n=1 Tax=Anaeramoeba flamelloides TaxID=1746091 RepID=A0AAV7YX10_9EUKA|nr:ran-binding protein 9/10 [Anaeramoeba flamelloides]